MQQAPKISRHSCDFPAGDAPPTLWNSEASVRLAACVLASLVPVAGLNVQPATLQRHLDSTRRSFVLVHELAGLVEFQGRKAFSALAPADRLLGSHDEDGAGSDGKLLAVLKRQACRK